MQTNAVSSLYPVTAWLQTQVFVNLLKDAKHIISDKTHAIVLMDK